MDKPDYMSDEEFRDLEELKAKIKERKISCFDYLVYVSRYTENDLKTSGYGGKTIGQAMEMIVKDAIKAITKMNNEYIRKYPDER